jgi:hypothetical protein
MRRMLVTSFALSAAILAPAALPQAAGSKTPLTLTKIVAHWSGSTRSIFVDTTWAPKSYATKVTVKISVDGNALRTLQVKRWVIGHKLFKLTVPETIANNAKARIDVRVHSQAGDDHRAVTLGLPTS